MTSAPSGRTANPTANVAKDASVAATGSPGGKNSRFRTSALMVLNRMKPDHSSAVPMVVASTTRVSMAGPSPAIRRMYRIRPLWSRVSACLPNLAGTGSA
ncbi:hypothetical protein GCM10010313_50470 [Streptomyces violarus]|uniref:Uncharacterized protein n=1 Tax=Streptomyces violarus TaxID=67380 RepID=A0A7W5F2V3_9ACTN|nr:MULTISPECIES: hypothetical protein [Streptomyces]MBB3078032.1 hypothetical protein [Streptomyces violarus]WRT99805.1 hypothetical protein VJ737_19810 [Streptomyces sp. CGMCC 4.1772]GHD19384.1 hypothetical protein GCM10010313_50470 [Streptomyces violarus]